MSDANGYEVGTPESSGSQRAAQPRPRAVFVAHGMGQQVPFETLDDVARGLCEAIEANDGKITKRIARTVRAGCETIQRLELEIEGRPPIHIYEGYWAPLTEGVIGLWQILRFLVSGGLNGIRSGGKFFRFVFGKTRTFHVPFLNIAALLLTVLFIIAMVIVGATVLTVGIGRLTMEQSEWITTELVEDLTGTFELLLAVILGSSLVAVVVVMISRFLMRMKLDGVAKVVRILVLVPVFAIVVAFLGAAYLAIPLDVVFDSEVRISIVACDSCPAADWAIVFPNLRRLHDWLDELRICPWRDNLLWYVLAVLAAFVVLVMLVLTFQPVKRFRAGRIAGAILSIAGVLVVLALCGNSIALAYTTWILLLGIVLFVRKFLIEFVGDVAIYVSPHVVDRFFDVRQRIKTAIWKAMRAVYAFRVYDGIVIVGHSLGSVAVYDGLNRLINEDRLAADGVNPDCCDGTPVEDLDVESRTKLLLTFGSPLDKTAFVFAMHDSGGGKERDALAASVQPLIAEKRNFPWINFWSRWDILGSSVDYYHYPPEDKSVSRVQNDLDPDAVTPFVAHVEFWQHRLIYATILDHLDK